MLGEAGTQLPGSGAGLLEDIVAVREWEPSCVPPHPPSSLREMDIHALLEERSRKQLASKCRVAQPGHRGENTKNKPKKIP